MHKPHARTKDLPDQADQGAENRVAPDDEHIRLNASIQREKAPGTDHP
jgi:hypothetical protein